MSSLFSRAALKAVKPAQAEFAKFFKASAINYRMMNIGEVHDRYSVFVYVSHRKREQSDLHRNIRSYYKNGSGNGGGPGDDRNTCNDTDIEEILRKLEFQYGSEPKTDVLLRALAVSIRDLQMAREDRKAAEINLVTAEINLETARHDAAVFEFLLASRRNLEILRKYFGKKCPDRNEFIPEIKKRVPAFADLSDENFMLDDDELLLGGKYFRSVLWMLATTPTIHSEQIEKLRVKLGRNPLNYIWFAKQSQSMYGFYSADFHDETKVANLKYIDLKFIKQYVEGLPTDLRKAMLLFWDVE